MDGNSITNSGDTVTLTLRGREDTDPYTVQRVSLVQRDAETLDGDDASWVHVTFGSDWNTGGTVPAGGTLTSDPVTFDLVAGEDVFLTYWVGTDQASVLRKIGSQTMAWVIRDDDESATVDWGALTISDTRNQIFAALRLEATQSTTTTVAAPGTSTTTLIFATLRASDIPLLASERRVAPLAYELRPSSSVR